MAEKDRRTRMVMSSVNAPAKKGGAGGAYTWGNPLDVQQYEGGPAVSSPTAAAMPVGVMMAPAPTMITSTVSAPTTTFKMDMNAFPTLGATPAPVTAVQSWGPRPVPSPAEVILSSESLRTGALDVVDAQHPRNQFAKKPHVRPATTVVQSAPIQQGLIDWSQAGMPEAVVRSILHSNEGAAHLGPYAQAAPSVVPLDVLRPQAVATQQQFQNYTPKISQATMRPKPTVIHQPQKR